MIFIRLLSRLLSDGRLNFCWERVKAVWDFWTASADFFIPLSKLLPYTIEELSAAIGAATGTVTITDENFAAGIGRKCDEQDKGGN